MRVVVWEPRGRHVTLAVQSRETVGSVCDRACEEFGLKPHPGVQLLTRTSSARRALRRAEPMPRTGQYELVEVGGAV